MNQTFDGNLQLSHQAEKFQVSRRNMRKLRFTSLDQLAPFEGRWELDSNSSSYDGTIFRVPLVETERARSYLRHYVVQMSRQSLNYSDRRYRLPDGTNIRLYGAEVLQWST